VHMNVHCTALHCTACLPALHMQDVRSAVIMASPCVQLHLQQVPHEDATHVIVSLGRNAIIMHSRTSPHHTHRAACQSHKACARLPLNCLSLCV
jgi:hypothetical protein